jgi:type I restriction enzyme, S subunit
MSSIGENTLPDRWDLVRLEELSNISIGKTPPRSNKELFLGNNIWLSIRDLKGDVVSVSNEKITDKAVISSNMKIISEGTLLMSFKLTLGRTAFAGCDLFTNEAIASLPIKDETVLNKYFLKYALATIDLEKEVDNAVKGKTLNKQKLKNLEIPLPPLEEQKRIVAKIDALFAKIDKAITLTEASLKKARNLLPSVLKEIFEEGKADGWKFEKLGVLGKLTSSKRIYKKEYVSQGIPFYRSKEIKELSYNRKLSVELFISEQRYTEIKNKFGIPKEGDLLLTAVGTIGEMYIVKKNEKFYFKDGNIMWLKDFLNLNPYYLRYALTNFVERLKALSQGSAYQALTIEKLKEYSIPIPTFKEQEKILAKLDEISNQTIKTQSKLEEQLAYLNQLKSSILSKAFKGEL